MNSRKKLPKAALAILAVIFLMTIFAGVLAPYSPKEMDPSAVSLALGGKHLFGTDQMGRDLLSLILYGGRASLYIGLVSSLISTTMAVIYGTVSGLAGEKTDDLLMRFSELMMSIPSILLIIFLQALWGQASYLSLSVIIGLTGWMNISKVVRSEVRQLAGSDYILAAKTMGAGFWYILWRHLLPNFIPSIMFMVVTNIGQAMITESTLSFMGLGLPLTEISWGSLLSMSQEALLSNQWWMILLPGSVLMITLICMTSLGEYIRKSNSRKYSNL